MAKVEVRPLPRKSWHNKENEEMFTRPKSQQVLVDAQTGRFATGLTEEEAAEYSKKLGLDLSDTYHPDEPHPYWSSNAARIILYPQTYIYETDNARDFIKVKNMTASKFVANSMKEYEQGLWPYATHVMHNEEAETEAKAVKINIKNKAMELSLKLSDETKADIIQIINNKTVRGKSTNFLNVEVDDILTREPETFIRIASMDANQRFLNALILEALYRNILTKEGTGICYMGNVIAHTMEDAVVYLSDPNNQQQKALIISKMGGVRKTNTTPVTTSKVVDDARKEDEKAKVEELVKTEPVKAAEPVKTEPKK